ncbi:MAG: hypothetical protein JWO82_1462 [Akkermansiaceae bacterium]|nr:hypothetical protein [Akkermansiaceae bacterium]
MTPEAALTEVAEFRELLGTSIDGKLPLVVGGHAVSLWALIYRDRLGSKLDEFFPLLSKDLDLLGDARLLEELHRIRGGVVLWAGARSPLIGQLKIEIGGKVLKVEVLREVLGVTRKQLQEGSQIITIDEVEACIPSPVVQLQAKIANVARIDQSDRNDLRHLRIMMLVVREFLVDVLTAVKAGTFEPRAAIDELEAVRTAVSSNEATRCIRIASLDLSAVWPRELLRSSDNERIRKFVEHRLPA